MFDNDTTAQGNMMDQTAGGQQFIEGTPVFDAGGEKLGTVSEHNVQGQYLIVHKGWLFPQDVYVPLQVVQRSDVDGVYLNLYKDEVLNQDWNAPPVNDSMSSATTTTMADDTLRTDTMRDTTSRRHTTDAEDVRVPVMKEELVVGKQENEIGRVHLHKDVIEEQQTVEEPVTREQVYVERVPVQGEYTDAGPDAFTEKDIDVPVMGEELVTGKRAVVTEEVRLHKDAVTKNERVSDTVRRERVTVDGADDVRGADNMDTGYSRDDTTTDTYRKNK